jgi:NAD(P) transhydrogenase subunit alpha
MLIGIPKEIMQGERRVGLTVWVENGAGAASYYGDADYAEAGAQLVSDAAALFAGSDVILKVKEPQFNTAKNIHEVDMMKEGQYYISFIHPAAPANHEMVKAMAAKGVTSLTLDGVPRISRAQNMDALTSMSTCAGYKGTIMAVNDLSKFVPQIFSAVGMIKPINALIIGVGVAGLQALATVKRLGAVVYAADIRPAAVEQAKSLGAKIVDLGIAEEYAVGEGGYALGLSDELLSKEREALKEIIAASDIIFLSALVPNKMAPILITEEMVKLSASKISPVCCLPAQHGCIPKICISC